ncbi:TPA: hypothetical protein L5P38_002220 [Pseudomonas aeruginosa]|nr:hypothetical protein [Pseudomonas aeruginosa]
MSEVKRFDHVNHAHVDDCEHIENPEGLWVKASDYDALAAEAQALREEVAKLTQYNKSLNEENTRLLVDCEETDKEVVVLRTKLAMAEDAAAKGYAARQQCGGMEMEIEELRAELAELRARVVVPDGFALVPIEPNDEMLSAGCVADNAMHSNLSNRDNKHRCYQSMLNAAPRLNGLTVSEGLLRRLARPAHRYDEVFTVDRHEAAEELRALLSEQGGRNCQVFLDGCNSYDANETETSA